MSRRKVTEEEFNTFVKGYPNKLVKDVCGIVDPPVLTYNDFKKADFWPESIVASVSLASTRLGEHDSYYIHD